jgi:hypothetical protein
MNDLHKPSLPVAKAQNNYPKKKFLCMPMVTISICSRTLMFDPRFSELLRKPPVKTMPPSFYVAVIFARLPRKPLPQSGTSYLPNMLLKTTRDKMFFEVVTAEARTTLRMQRLIKGEAV